MKKKFIFIKFHGICLSCTDLEKKGSTLFLENCGLTVCDIDLNIYSFKYLKTSDLSNFYELIERC